MRWADNDGGRAAAGYRGDTGDCVCRALAIATGRSYQDVYDTINAIGKGERITRRQRSRSTARGGVRKRATRKLLEAFGGRWVPTMGIGTGCRVHLRDGELPMGRLVVQLSKHVVAVVDGMVHDTYNPTRGGTRCVYGYAVFP